MAARHPEQFTVVGNHLAQHPEMSLTAIGLATHIQSLPEGTPVGIKALAAKFPEGETRIAAALRELEVHGYLARIKERTPSGHIVTRTISYNNPRLNPAVSGQSASPPGPRREPAPEPEEPEPAAPAAETHAVTAPQPLAAERISSAEVQHPSPTARSEPHHAPLPTPRIPVHASPYEHAATALLAALRADDPRLLLSARDIHRLTPALCAWLERAVDPAAVRRALTASLPQNLGNPAGLLAHRLTELLPPPLPAATVGLTPPPRPAPFQTCDGCERAFRATEPGLCRDCTPLLTAA
ncbi:helix-turn-helix domain-containing protein [Streptomyces sp. NPDC048277]|uniref:helix-turn-helix domain-containing protein n=1 Tax=Streptomyces sp. NPDC048277 TaxID=3155027 RepID=UPI0033C6F73E